ncbi:LysM peptidoglycan-binding domain-containing M23 family metallopeptidase [Deinococcus multiflagellatus]|uniref:LysM peptidoglycan-binding domain-containing M23 family metallopeptidase n=1 Tax=Deinococcus multiflagellatus TaxID=1656887 RepID=UPI001CCF7466|nr:M23 family metallopeptidase [Deinococcus multiflagellatus]MBZ9712104.1 LysM peptidoglycan-binding domain-containing M23 family metallopeptidase [Deinococcus multiflagellatus]
MIRRTALLAALLCVGGAAAYTVKPGDTLYSIARANGTTVEVLARLNGLQGTALKVGQELKLPGAATAATPAASATPAAPVTPAPLPPEQLAPTPTGARIAGVNITVPASLRMGEAFVVRLSGARAGEATVRFPSEVGEDVRRPNEALKPVGAAGEYVVPGRVVLGKTTPVVYEVTLDGALVRGRIPVTGLDQPIQHLNLPPRISSVLQDPARKAEDALVEGAYARRTPQAWSRPFAPALKGTAPTSSSFGQPRTYVAGGPVAYHFGTDYPARAGTPVLAVNDGTVVIAGRYPVRGGLVVIDHGAGVTSLYFHQSKVSVKVGQKVARGDKLGEVGSTGLSAGPHLHLEIRVRGEGTNPASWMNRLWPR